MAASYEPRRIVDILVLKTFGCLNLLIAIATPVQIVGLLNIKRFPVLKHMFPFNIYLMVSIASAIAVLSLIVGIGYLKKSYILSFYPGLLLCIAATIAYGIWLMNMKHPYHPILIRVMSFVMLAAVLLWYGTQFVLLVTRFRKELKDA